MRMPEWVFECFGRVGGVCFRDGRGLCFGFGVPLGVRGGVRGRVGACWGVQGYCWAALGGWLGLGGWCQLWLWAASRALALRQLSGSPMVVRRAERVMRAGVCQSCQRSFLGEALARSPCRRSCWNQATSARLMTVSAVEAALASQSVNGMRVRPESLRRLTVSSTRACSLVVRSSSTGSPAASVRNPQ